jgi:multiple sugar transport system ATP-binding protein
MSTKIAVMKEGIVQQYDSPDKIYHFPANLFVADFIGNPKVNFLTGKIIGKNSVDIGAFKIPAETLSAAGDVVVGVRPEDIGISTTPTPGGVEFTAYSVLPSGADSTIIARQGAIELTIRVIGISKIKMDERIWLTFDPASLNLYQKESGNLITQ